MSNFFLNDYKTNWSEKLNFPFFPVYSTRHMQAAWESKTWLGRSVNFVIATVESILYFGALLALVERCLAWHYQSKNLPEIKKIFGQDSEEKLEPIQYTDLSPVANPIEIEDDLPPLISPIEIEKENQEDEFKLIHISDSFLVVEGSPIEVEKEEAIEDLKKSSLSEEKILQEVSSLPALDKIATQKEATHLILATPGFIADFDDRLGRYGYKGEIQGSKALRFVVAKATKQFPQAICPENLKKQREVNLEQYLTITLKRFAHAFSLEGFVSLPTGKKINLEGFCEAFTIPMLAASFENYSKQGKLFTVNDYQWIINQFNQTTSSDHTESDDIQALACMLQDPNFMGPLSLGTGYDWHSTATIFFGQYVIYCNRGKGDSPGIHIYSIPDRSRLTEGTIWEMTKRQEMSGNDVFRTKRIVKDLEGVLVHYEELPSQDAGNCTLVSMETALFAFMAIRQFLNFFGEGEEIPQDCIDSTLWHQLFKNARPEYDQWWNIDRIHVFQEMINEIREWLDKKNDFSQYDLKKTYQQLLDAWHQKYKHKEPLKGKSLSILMQPLLDEFGID